MFGIKVVTATYYSSDCSTVQAVINRTSCCISQCLVHYSIKFDAYIFIQSGATDIFLFHITSKSCVLRLLIWSFRHVDSVKFEMCTKSGSNICYSHWDWRRYASDLHLMTSREFTSGFKFWSRGNLCMALLRHPMKFGAYIFIQSGVIDIYPQFKMAAAAILELLGWAMGPPTKPHSWCVVHTSCKNFVMIG